jgi:lipoprotein-releasing system permease protein
MYKLTLILKYLRKRRIAWISLIAVMLCTAMVIIILSVMGGWLKNFREQFHGIVGDIEVSRLGLAGFPYYDEMISEIEALPEVKAAAPTLQTFGLVNIFNQIPDGVQVIGYDIGKISQITEFGKSLYAQYESQKELANDKTAPEATRAEARARLAQPPTFEKPLRPDIYRDIWQSAFPKARKDAAEFPGIIVGSGVVGIERQPDGTFKGRDGIQFAWVRLTVLSMSEGTMRLSEQNISDNTYWIIDDSRTKLWQYDQNTVYVPFNFLQRDLGMDAHTDESGNKVPAQTHRITIGLKDSSDIAGVVPKLQQIVDNVLKRHDKFVEGRGAVTVRGWYDTPGTKDFLQAVEKEIVLVTFLFAMVSVVAIFLIFCIFFMIVVEKTKDIGIVKAVGATSWGVAQIFLGYGLAIGIVGGGLGLLGAYLIVHNINEIHQKLGEWTNGKVQVWDAKTYAFDTIPDKLNPAHCAIIVGVAILASLVGALIPAIRAARMNPVEALRWE